MPTDFLPAYDGPRPLVRDLAVAVDAFCRYDDRVFLSYCDPCDGCEVWGGPHSHRPAGWLTAIIDHLRKGAAMRQRLLNPAPPGAPSDPEVMRRRAENPAP